MAHGYARTTGKVGVCMSTSGPGATNFVTCLADAKMDSIPIIAITGQVSTPVIGTDAFQETPIVEVCRGITKHHYLRHAGRGRGPGDEGGVPHRHHRPARAGHHRHAARTCRTSRSCPDWDAADEPARLPAVPARPSGPNWSRSSPPSARARSRSSTPAAASSHSGAAAELKEFAELTGIPVGLTAARARQLPGRPLPVPAHARHARHRVLELRRQRGRPAAGLRRPVRRPRDRQADRVRQARQDRPHRHRQVARSTRTSSPTSRSTAT